MTGRPRILHVTTTPEFARLILLHDLRRLRDRVDSVVVCAPGPGLEAVRAEGFETINIPIERKITPAADLGALWSLIRILRARRVDVLHSYVPKGGLIGQLAGWIARVPVRIHSCRGLLYTDDMPRWRRVLYRFTDRLTNRLADRTIYISGADRDLSVRERLCRPEKARFTGSGIDLAYFDRARVPADARARVRRDLGLPAECRVVLTVGRFVTDKGYRELAAVIPAILAAHPDVRFVWVAPVLPGEEGALPDEFLVREGLADRVVRLPLQADVRPLYVAADLLVHPTHREGVPRVLMEAAAMGLPIVTTDVPGCREVIATNVLGLLVATRDAAALGAAVTSALTDAAATAARAARAGAFVRDAFDADTLADRIWGIYDEVLKERGTVSPGRPLPPRG